MQIQDCPWEIENIGRKTVQLNYTLRDKYSSNELQRAIDNYQYIVAKVPSGNINCLLGLQEDGFKLIETQISLSMKMKDFNFNDKFVVMLSKHLSFEIIKDKVGLKKVLNHMTPNMFTTDRIHLDPEFGPNVGLHRYRNWMCTEFNQRSLLNEYSVDGIPIGFGLSRIKAGINYGLLGGVYEEYQKEGYGILTAANNCLFPKIMGLNDVKRCKTVISSNNMPVIDFYSYLHFKVNNLEYVLIKHQK